MLKGGGRVPATCMATARLCIQLPACGDASSRRSLLNLGLAVSVAQIAVDARPVQARAPGIVETKNPVAPGERAVSLTSTGENLQGVGSVMDLIGVWRRKCILQLLLVCA